MTENYTYKDANGTRHTVKNIPTAEVNKLQVSLGISHLEALELWCCDNGKKVNAEQEALNAKAGKRKKNAKAPDQVKVGIISKVAACLESVDNIGDITVTNAQGEIVFYVDGAEYKIKLSKSRVKA